MKKRIIAVYRMGSPNVVKGEKAILLKIIGGAAGEAGLLQLPTGMLHLLVTTMTPADAAKCFANSEDMTNQLPVMVFDIDSSDNAIHLDSLMPFSEMLADFKKRVAWGDEDEEEEELDPFQEEMFNNLINYKETSLTLLDELLDKIGQVGLDGLSDEEKTHLDTLSK